MLKSCPASVEDSELQFKLQCRLKIFENEDFSSFSNTNSLLSCASRYGLLFVGSNSNHFQVIQTQTLHSYGLKDKNVVDYPRRNIEIPSPAKHICVNCDSTLLAVVIEKDQCPIVIFYEVLSFLRQNVNVIKEIRLSSTPNVYVREINWNPSLPAVFTACKSDGSLGVYELKGESVDINELPAAAGATCFCWSPKGKQIAVGSKDGRITQYKPDLKAVKAIGEPKLEGPHMIINLQWVSNYQFIGVYQSVQGSASYIIVVDAPKTGEPSYTNYDDICYSGSSRSPQFYLILQQTWNFLMVGSANSAEVGVLGSNGVSWIQWIMADNARAELPLSPDHQETLPVGLTFDISSTTPLPWGESSIPPCPTLCVLSHQGVLCCFNVVYLREGIPSVCTPPDPVGDTSGLSSFTTSSANKKNEIVPPKPQFGATDTQSKISSTPAKEGLFSFPSASTALNIQHQSTPLVTAKSSADSLPKTLFGGQASLTPIKPQQPSQGMPLFGGQTLITPISKGPNGTVPSTNSAPNYNEKYSSIFSSVQPTPASQCSAVPVKPIVISASSVKPEATKLQEAVSKPQAIPPKTQFSTPKEAQKSVAKQEPPIDNKAETSAMLSQMIRDEWMYLETELKLLLNLGRGVKVNVGTDKEKVDMVEQIASLQEFVKEAVDISVGQSSEIHFLKQNLIQSWAWFEEAKSHYNSSKNEAVALLIKFQPLDSLSQKRLKDIEQLIYYVESQLSQASKALDEQWDNFQDYAKKTHKAKMPTMEAIFQTMVSQCAILQKHRYTLKDISMRLRRKPSNMNSLLLSLDEGRDLADDFQELHLDPQDILQLQYEKIKNHTKSLSETKAKKLRNLLNQREVTRVTAIKPQLSSWAINQSPASRMRQSISKLGSSMSSVAKASVARNLDFVQSPSMKALDIVQLTPEKPALATTPNAASAPSSFFPLLKSGPVISSSQGSAFTPIGGAATSIAASNNQQQLFKSPASSTPTFSFGGPSVAPNKSVPITSSFSSEALRSSTGVATTTSGKLNFSMAGSVFKSASETATVKPQPAPATSTFDFGPNGAVPLNFAGKPIRPQPTPSFASSSSNSSFPISTASSSSAFGSLTNLNKPNAAAAAVSSSQNIKKIVTSAAAATDSAPSTPKPTSGVASIFANLQSVIDKATSPTAADSSKPASVTTTTQSVFGSFTASSTAGNFFGSIAKPAADSAASPAMQGIFGAPPNSSSTSIFGQPTKVAESSSSASDVSSTVSESVKASTAAASKPETTNVITVSLFGSKPTTAASAATPTTTSIFAPQTNTNIFGTSTTPSSTVQGTISAPASSIFEAPKATISSTVTTTVSSPIFGTPSQRSTIFGSSTSSTPMSTTTANIFATNTSSTGTLFGTSSATPACGSGVFSTPTTSIFESPTQSKSIFGSTTTTTSTTAPAFGSPAASTATNTFGTPAASTAISAFGTAAASTATSAFGTPAASTVTSAFGTPAACTATSALETAAASTATSAFGTPAANTVASAFGTPAASSVTSAFGTPAASSAASAFGTPAASTATSAFGTSAANTVTSAFGTPAASAATSAFGTPATSTATTAFGTPANIFGTPTPSNAFDAATTKPSLFGSPASGSIFGAAAPATSANIFASPPAGTAGAFGTAAATTSASIFGSPTPATTTSSSVFGSSTTGAFGSQSGSIFGATNTSGNAFGQPAAFGSQTAAFGGAQPTTASPIFGQSSAFGAASQSSSVFGSTTTPASTSGNIFGSAAASSSGFGSGFGTTATTNAFGSPAATQPSSGSFGFGGLSVGATSSSESIFGGSSGGAFNQTPNANPFGKVEAKPAFGSSSSSIFGNAAATPATTNAFGSPASTANSIFGSTTGGSTFGSSTTGGGFGSPSAFGGAGGTSTFGQKPAFGQPAAFGASSFGSPQGGAFSGGATSPVAQSGFGSPATFQKPGFGSGPIFGGSPAPAFGASPSFGGTASFGSAPAFGSPEKVFGSTQPASGGFAANASQNAGFGNIASQNTIGFGNLAQQANTSTSMPFSGNSSFSSWR